MGKERRRVNKNSTVKNSKDKERRNKRAGRRSGGVDERSEVTVSLERSKSVDRRMHLKYTVCQVKIAYSTHRVQYVNSEKKQ